MNQSLALNPPVRGQWAIMNPPGHAKLAFDFLAVDDRKSPYKDVSLLRHVFSTLSAKYPCKSLIYKDILFFYCASPPKSPPNSK